MRYHVEQKRFVSYRELKFLFKDSTIIAERDKLTMITNQATGERRESVSVIGYTFIDLRTKSFYMYENFSDTARIEKSYKQPVDGKPEGGWTFFMKPSPKPSNSISLPDTTVDGTTYKRVKSYHPWDIGGKDTAYWKVQYFDCNNKTPFLFVGQVEGAPEGCVMTISESYMLRNNLWLYDMIEVVSTRLTLEEEKVFDAWKKNAERNPAD